MDEFTLNFMKTCSWCNKSVSSLVRLKCFHSCCHPCLQQIPKVSKQNQTEQRNHIASGWICRICGIFTDEKAIEDHKLLNKLVKRERKTQIQTTRYHKPPSKLYFVRDLVTDILFGDDPLQNIKKKEESIIDETFYCKRHQKQRKMDLFCYTCQKLICKDCKADHKCHNIITTHKLLQEMDGDMEDYRNDIAPKLRSLEQQIKCLEKEIENTKEASAKWKIKSDSEFKLLLEKMEKAKAEKDEQVQQLNMKNIEELNKIKDELQSKTERYRVLLNLACITKKMTGNESRLLELQSGLFEQAKILSKTNVATKRLTLVLPSTSQNIKKVTTIEGLRWCNRVNIIGKKLCIAHGSDNTIDEFSVSGECMATFDNVHNTIVVRQANNGDILTGGQEGLFIAYHNFTEWRLLYNGCFSDISTHQDCFTALRYDQYQVITFKYIQGEWKIVALFDIEGRYIGNWVNGWNATLTVDKNDNIIVCNQNALLVYSFEGQCVKSIRNPSGDYRITGEGIRGNLILCAWTGELYSIDNILEFDSDKIDRYLVCKKNECIRDLIIDCDRNMWVLHGNTQFYLTKYEPLRYNQNILYDFTERCTEVEVKQIVQPVQYETKVRDLGQFVDFKQTYKKSKPVKISEKFCNRLGIIDQLVYIAHENHNCIRCIDSSGKCIKKYKKVPDCIVVKQANNGSIIAAGKEGLFVINGEFKQWDEIQPGEFSDIAIYGNKFSALEYMTGSVREFVYYHNNWHCKSSFDLVNKHQVVGCILSNKATLSVDRDSNVVVCNQHTVMMYSSGGVHIRTIKLWTGAYFMINVCQQWNALLCDKNTGKIYGINDIENFDCETMHEYEVEDIGIQNICDITIDHKGSMWVLHQDDKYYLTKWLSSTYNVTPQYQLTPITYEMQDAEQEEETITRKKAKTSCVLQ